MRVLGCVLVAVCIGMGVRCCCGAGVVFAPRDGCSRSVSKTGTINSEQLEIETEKFAMNFLTANCFVFLQFFPIHLRGPESVNKAAFSQSRKVF